MGNNNFGRFKIALGLIACLGGCLDFSRRYKDAGSENVSVDLGRDTNKADHLNIVDSGSRDETYLSNKELDARLDCPEIIDGLCTYRFNVGELNCWDGSESTGRILAYSFTSNIPGIGDLYGNKNSPVLCGASLRSGVYEGRFSVWTNGNISDTVVTKNIINR